MVKYIPVIGMEVHVELKTKSKMFCDCKNGLGEEKEPNLHICPVCSGQPGTLPYSNKQAIEFVQLAGLALNCEINLHSKFDRKNYFYPDLPKGYQISQYDMPFCRKGYLEISVGNEQGTVNRKIGITRVHLEEDTGKLLHPIGTDYTLVDFNRAGVPLMELVTEPDIESGEEARIFCQKLRQIFRYLQISDADMEKGNMRCEVNISLYKKGEGKLSGTKVEVKNINSFKFVEKAINYEIERQTEILEKGEKVVQETRGWDSNRNTTISQRVKESAHDYRYFPEPDIPPFEFTAEYVENLRRKLPELPEAKAQRFKKEFSLPEKDIEILISEKDLADYFEDVVSELREKIDSQEFSIPGDKVIKVSANYIITELRKHLVENNESIRDIKITPENYAEFIGFIASGKINSSAAQIVLQEMYRNGSDPSQVIEEKNLLQMEDDEELEKIIEEVLKDNQKSVEDYKKGKQNAFQFLIGQILKASKGKANPKNTADILKKKLG
ncbi:MAG: Asp-tRNA(Asn)/Glu-tRNA(Gln) amidotransferase subunit GatB [Patescibacteria group bacterium]